MVVIRLYQLMLLVNNNLSNFDWGVQEKLMLKFWIGFEFIEWTIIVKYA